MKMRRHISSIGIGGAIAAVTGIHVQNARAAEREAVRFEVEAPDSCVDERDLRTEIASLGAEFRDANLEDRARTFRVEVTRGDEHVKGRLIVRDLVFRERVREVNASTCAEMTKSLALFVATALDEAPPVLAFSPAPASDPPAPWPAPTETDASMRTRAGRRGSGGLVVSGLAGYGFGTDDVLRGVHAYGAARVGDTTRIGLAATLTEDERNAMTASADTRARGLSSRIGALVGWGAPWNDSVVGFSAEVGVSWAALRGTTTPGKPLDAEGFCTGTGTMTFVDMACYDDSRTTTKRWSLVSPFVAANLVFQVPIKRSVVRPIVALGNTWVPGHGMASFLFTAEAGVVWQAW